MKNTDSLRKRIEEISVNLNQETYTSLLLVRQASKAYYSHSHQLTFDDLKNEVLQRVDQLTPWDFVVNRHGGTYISAIVYAMSTLKFQDPAIDNLINPQKYKESDESVLKELIGLLSEPSAVQIPFSVFYEDYWMRKPLTTTRVSGDFYTPIGIAHCLGSLLKPEHGKLYDPCCGSGALLLGAVHTVQENNPDLDFYGQVNDLTSYQICNTNFTLRGLHVDLGEKPADTLIEVQHSEIKFNYIISNPPFNSKNWYKDCSILDDQRWCYGIPPCSNANFAWLQHIVHQLAEDGRAAVIMPNSTLTSQTSQEKRIREAMICDGVVKAILVFSSGLFYATKVPFCIWILERSHNNNDSILFVDTERMIPKIRKILTDENIKQITGIYEKHQDKELLESTDWYAVVNQNELKERNYILSPNLFTVKNRTKASEIRKNMTYLEDCFQNLRKVIPEKDFLYIYNCYCNIPQLSQWHKVPLLDLYDEFGGVTKNKQSIEQEYPLLDVKTVIKNAFIPEVLKSAIEVTKEQISVYDIKYGDVFLNRTSESNEQLACCCIALKNYDAVYSCFLKRLRPKDNHFIYPAYAAGYLNSTAYRREVENVSTVFTTRASFNHNHLSKMSFYFPDFEIQKCIGDTLLATSYCLQHYRDTKQYDLLIKFWNLLIEQYITCPIFDFLEREED